jgi:isoquinoline 1-oxidoreductase beta subunit
MNVWTRKDDMQHDFYRPMSYSALRAGLDKSGNPVSWHHRIAGPNRGLVVHAVKPPYAFPHYLIDAHTIDTGVPTGAWRSVGASHNGWIIESFVDELAHASKTDPLEFRRKLLTSSRLKGALEYVAEKAGWGKPLPKGVGRGIACVESFGSAVAHVAEVSVDKNGNLKIHRIVTAVDCGPVVNLDTLEAQMEGAVAFALSAALKDEITIDRGRVQQGNFDDYRILQLDEMPKVEVHVVPSTEPVGGIGEPGIPPVVPAVCNAIFAATGKRVRKLPIRPADLMGT